MTSTISNVLLIDQTITDYNVFVTSVNASTIPIVYSSATTRAELLTTLRAYTSIDRIGIAFSYSVNVLFLEEQSFIDNMNFIIQVIQQCHVKHIDYLACSTLNIPEWANYYATITEQTGVIIGASNDNTGNIVYGGDWVLESTGQDIEMIYFTESIEYYTYLLDSNNSVFSVMIKQDNTIYFAGDNLYNTTQTLTTPANINTLQKTMGLDGLTPSLIARGNDHILILMDNADIYVCGRNDNGQLNTGDLINRHSYAPMLNTIGLTPKQIDCGGLSTYILMDDASGSIYVCGVNQFGQLGLDNTTTPITSVERLVNTTGKIPKSIHSGTTHLIVLMTDNTIYGTGFNSSGQLGIGNNTNQSTLQLMQNTTGKTLKQLVCGNTHTILLMTDNTIYVTGQNSSGQLGLGDYSNRLVLTQMPNTTGKTPLTIYSSYLSFSTYVLMTDGTIYGTGRNNLGQLGIGSTTNQNTLQLLQNSTGKTPIAMSCSARHILILMSDNSIYACGENVAGQLGLGYYGSNQLTIILMPNTTGLTVNQVICADRISIILMNNNSIYTTGSNTYGQLGLGYSRYFYSYSQITPFTYLPVMIEYGAGHMIVLTTTGDIYGNGLNGNGQLGLGNITNQTILSLMQNTTGRTPIFIACGASHTVVLMNDASGSIYGTGINGNGQLGTNNTTQSTSLSSASKMIIPSGVIPKAISCGTSHTLVLMTNGTIYSTGLNDNGQLGTNNLTQQITPTLVVNTTGLLAYEVACGAAHSIVLMNDASGSIYGTGLNTSGQLGLGNNTQMTSLSSSSKMQNTTGLIPVDIACGANHTIVLMNDASGSIYGTGLNDNGQLGIGNTTNQTTLQLMTNSSGLKPVAISCGAATTYVLMSNGTLYGTGLQTSGQLGLGLDNRIYKNQYTTLQLITPINLVRRLPSSAIYLNSPSPPAPCFKEGTLILTDKGYVPIEELRNGDLVKTVNDYKAIHMIGKQTIYNLATPYRIKDQLYVCTSDHYPEVFEPLVITGFHSILVDEFCSESQKEKVIKLSGGVYITENMYRVPACVDERSEVYDKKGQHVVYHIALENDDYYMNYGVYANGLLVETCSKRYLKELSNMEILE